MFFLKIYIWLDLYVSFWLLPILIIWCFIPGKGIKEGLSEWFNEDL